MYAWVAIPMPALNFLPARMWLVVHITRLGCKGGSMLDYTVHMEHQWWIAVICVCSSIIYTVSLFYCFGVSVGDALLTKENDGSSALFPLSIPYRFFGTYESTLYVSQLLGCTSQVCRHAYWNLNGVGTCCSALNIYTFYYFIFLFHR